MPWTTSLLRFTRFFTLHSFRFLRALYPLTSKLWQWRTEHVLAQPYPLSVKMSTGATVGWAWTSMSLRIRCYLWSLVLLSSAVVNMEYYSINRDNQSSILIPRPINASPSTLFKNQSCRCSVCMTSRLYWNGFTSISGTFQIPQNNDSRVPDRLEKFSVLSPPIHIGYVIILEFGLKLV